MIILFSIRNSTHSFPEMWYNHKQFLKSYH